MKQYYKITYSGSVAYFQELERGKNPLRDLSFPDTDKSVLVERLTQIEYQRAMELLRMGKRNYKGWWLD